MLGDELGVDEEAKNGSTTTGRYLQDVLVSIYWLLSQLRRPLRLPLTVYRRSGGL
jgi:hypothetical protein